MVEAKKLVVVDDEPDALEFVKMVLEGQQYVVQTADSAEKGLETVKANMPDAVILDVQMPGKDGFWLFQEMKRSPNLGDIKVIMLTGVAQKSGIGFNADLMENYFGEAPDEYVEKPVRPEILLEVVDRLLSAGV